MKFLACLLWMMSVCLSEAYQEGQTYAMTNEIKPSLESTGLNPSNNPVEASYSHDSMRTRLGQETQTNETFLQIKKAQRERKQEEIEVVLPELSEERSQEESLEIGISEPEPDSKDFVLQTCQMSGEHYTQTCKRSLIIELDVVPEISIDEKYCSHGGTHVIQGGWFRRTRSCSGCATRKKITQAKKVEITKEEWVGCEDLEAMRDRGEAEVLSETPGIHNEKRIINGEKITREYFETTRVYALNTKVVNTCDAFRVLGCQQIGSRCIEEKQLQEGPKICLMFEKTYKCQLAKTSKSQTKNKFGLDIPKGPTAVANQNMMNALSQLEAMKQISKFKTIDGDKVTFMKGDVMSCTTNFGGSFKDCCKSNGGFGTSIHLATGCTSEEQNLQRARQEGRCIFLGSKSKKKKVGINFSKEYRYCCFPSKLVLAIQTGAKQQLGKNFGGFDHPNCEGLHPDELKHVDFSQIDLSDTFKDIVSATNQMKRTLQNDFKNLNKRFENETRNPQELQSKFIESAERRKEKGEDHVY